jgi:hypothetical protein
MCRVLQFLCLVLWVMPNVTVQGATGSVMKVLPHLLDLQGRHTLSPSLYERDAYQAYLRRHPKERSGIRFDVNWKTKGEAAGALKLRVEARGSPSGEPPKPTVLEQNIEGGGGWFGHWTSFTIKGDSYKELGDVTAWRVTLWEGDKMIGEQKSFLW